MLRSLKIFAVAAVATLSMTAAASAAPIIDFRDGTSNVGGTITYDGSDVVATGIGIGTVAITGAPMGNSPTGFGYEVTGNNSGFGELRFDTGEGTISIIGCIADLGIGIVEEVGCVPVTLMSGTITAYSVDPDNGFGFGNILLGGFDTKNSDLLAALGLDPSTSFTFFGSDITTIPSANGSATSVSVDIANTTVVPEPATMVLLGTGLLAAFRARRRQA